MLSCVVKTLFLKKEKKKKKNKRTNTTQNLFLKKLMVVDVVCQMNIYAVVFYKQTQNYKKKLFPTFIVHYSCWSYIL